jgi:uncharacterized membrane protein YhaH (DUF805 family)
MANVAPGVNPYAGPKAAVAEAAGEYQEVKVFSTSGRIGRVRYIAYAMGMYFLIAVLGVLLSMVIGTAGQVISGLAILVIIFMLTIQRCHDFNATGWLSLLVLIPLVNLIFWIIPGTDGENRFGAKTPPNGAGVIIAACIVPILVIVGVVAAVAIPAYQQYATKAKQMQMQQQAPKR